MTDNQVEEIQPSMASSDDSSNRITIAVIIAFVIIVLACLAACTAVTLVFLFNAPWRF